mgnify:CR=1 FL=1
MNDWFIWNGARCTEYGMHVLELPPPTIPAERVTFTNVPGRPGSLTTLEGEEVYEDLVLTAQCVLPDPTKIPAIAAWLRGSGTVTFANRQGGFYYARIVNQIPFEKILRGNPHRSFAVNFRCKPFGSGSITLMVGMTIVELEGITGSITLDSRLQEAYSGVTSLNSAMSGDFPKLLPGNNAVSWTGNVTKVDIQPNWRYL